MKAYIKDAVVVAMHDDGQAVPASAYGEGVIILSVPNSIQPETPLSDLKVDLAEIKSALKDQVDAIAEAERLKYITSGNGQAMTYQQKVQEAQDYLAADDPDPASFPILSAEIGVTASSIEEVADTILAAYQQWKQIGAAIEAIRLGGKRDVDLAEDVEAAQGVVANLVWP